MRTVRISKPTQSQTAVAADTVSIQGTVDAPGHRPALSVLDQSVKHTHTHTQTIENITDYNTIQRDTAKILGRKPIVVRNNACTLAAVSVCTWAPALAALRRR